MKTLKQIHHLALTLLLLAPCGAAWADWELDNAASSVNFVSVKNDLVGEVHGFGSLMGFISDAGKAEVTIDLGSVQTAIDIRNERMREMLFETVKFPTAVIHANVDPAVLAVAAKGGVVTSELSATLSLHGAEKTLTVPVAIVGEGGNRLRVFSTQPVLVNAADFGLDAGVAALQKVAGLNAISNAVPVTMHLLFVPAK